MNGKNTRHLTQPLEKIMTAKEKIKKLQQIVNEQAEDEGLWFIPQYITEDYLQQALRKLHEIIEDKTSEQYAIQ